MVKLNLCTTKINISRKVEVQFNSLTSALYEGEWSAACPGSFIPHRKSPRYLLQRKLGGPESQAQCFGEEKNILSLAAVKSKFLSCRASSLVFIILCYSSHDDDDYLPVTLFNGSISNADIIWS
jgi:hypothetical protein